MSEDKFSQHYNIKNAKTIIDDIKKVGVLKGIVLANRKGDVIVENFESGFEANKYAAMCASVLESAENLGKNIQSQKTGKIVAELMGGQSIVIIECTENLFFSLALEANSKINDIFSDIGRFCQEILSRNKKKKL
ncbi:MAG: roadblock/LC7 domain-containing protein [Candidatus Hermodarchaeota archaeon]